VVEDTAITLADLAAEGFPEPVIAALTLLTHDDETPYMDYIARIKGNPMAVAVKKADLLHNSDLTRLDTIDDAAKKRAEKYRQALAMLTA